MIYSNSITRSFGNLKIKTSTIRGKTLTQVFDAEGNNILSRLKSFSSKKIGDKYVKTRTIVVRDNIKNLKEVYDRIYDGISNKLLGIRSTFYDTVSNGKLSKCGLVEQVSGGNRVVNAIENNMVVNTETIKNCPLGTRLYS